MLKPAGGRGRGQRQADPGNLGPGRSSEESYLKGKRRVVEEDGDTEL